MAETFLGAFILLCLGAMLGTLFFGRQKTPRHPQHIHPRPAAGRPLMGNNRKFYQ